MKRPVSNTPWQIHQSPRSYMVAVSVGSQLHRNRIHLLPTKAIPPPPPPAMSPASERHSDEPSPPEPLNCEAARLIANENILHPHELARDPV